MVQKKWCILPKKHSAMAMIFEAQQFKSVGENKVNRIALKVKGLALLLTLCTY
jgi:hypothetical protein